MSTCPCGINRDDCEYHWDEHATSKAAQIKVVYPKSDYSVAEAMMDGVWESSTTKLDVPHPWQIVKSSNAPEWRKEAIYATLSAVDDACEEALKDLPELSQPTKEEIAQDLARRARLERDD